VGGAAPVLDTLSITNKTVQELRDLREAHKFHENPAIFYPGAPNEIVRTRCQLVLNALIDRLIADLPAHPQKQFVLQQFRISLASFNAEESEQKDRLLVYLEQIMDIIGIESSDRLLNEWRYGFDPTKFPQ
jgi:hypothetical protein